MYGFLWYLPSRDGELVLVDAGCLYHGYISDVTRVWPVGGTFSCAQRDLYEAVLRVKQECIQVKRSAGSCFFFVPCVSACFERLSVCSGMCSRSNTEQPLVQVSGCSVRTA